MNRSSGITLTRYSGIAAFLAVSAAVALGAAATGCTATLTSGASGCTADGSIACAGGTGYACTGNVTPTLSSVSSGLACSNPTLSGAESLYCCVNATPKTVANGCTANAAVRGCQGGSFGVSCTNPTDAPTTNYPGFVCSQGTAGTNGGALYCCTNGGSSTLPTASCAEDATITGCTGGSAGYTCTGGTPPQRTNASLTCSVPTQGAGGAYQYCCFSGSTTTSSCAQDATIVGCQAGSYGFTCSNPGDDPNAVRAGLVCSAPTPSASGANQYCCTGG